jgi:hypothetical protein
MTATIKSRNLRAYRARAESLGQFGGGASLVACSLWHPRAFLVDLAVFTD